MKLEVLSRETAGAEASAPLLFVHGSSHAAWCWDEHFLPWFATEGFNAYAVSLRGHGKSEGSDRLRWTSVSDYVDDVRSVALRLPGAPVLIGHSLGGLVVQKYLERYTASGAVLLAPSPVLAPDEAVRNSSHWAQKVGDRPNAVHRDERLRYAAHRWVTDPARVNVIRS